MALSVATNTSAATAHRYLRVNDMEASRSLAKLSSGSRIVRAMATNLQSKIQFDPAHAGARVFLTFPLAAGRRAD